MSLCMSLMSYQWCPTQPRSRRQNRRTFHHCSECRWVARSRCRWHQLKVERGKCRLRWFCHHSPENRSDHANVHTWIYRNGNKIPHDWKSPRLVSPAGCQCRLKCAWFRVAQCIEMHHSQERSAQRSEPILVESESHRRWSDYTFKKITLTLITN